MTQGLKKFFSFFLRISISGLLLQYLSTKIGFDKTAEVLKSGDLLYILYALIVFFLIHVILLWRWRIFIKALDLHVAASDVIRYFFIGLFSNLFLPSSIGGDVIKIFGLCKNSQQKPRVVASVLLDRLSGFGGIVTVAVLAFFFGSRYVQEASLLIIIGLIALGSLITVVLFNKTIYEFCCRIFNFFPKVKKSLMIMHYDISLLRDKARVGLKVITLSCITQIMLAITYFLIAKGLHQDINIIYFLIFTPMICIAAAFPSIGGLGVRDAGAAYLFAKVGVAPEIAVSLSLIVFLFMIIIGLIGGLVYVFTPSSGRIQHHSSATAVEPKAS